MRWVIDSYQSVGPIRFGMTRDEVRRAVGQPYRAVKKGPEDIDGFDDLLLNVHYREDDGGCEFVEFSKGKVPLFFRDQNLVMPVKDLVAWVRNVDPTVLDRVGSLRSTELGLAFYVPHREGEPANPASAIAAFRRGYYDR